MPKGIFKKFNIEEVSNLIEDYKNGLSTNKLGPKYGCDSKTVSRILKRNGIEVLAKPFKLNTIQLNAFINDYTNGKTYSQLETKYNIERECVANTLVRCGVERRDPVGVRQHKVNDDFFEVIDTEEKAYWLGFLTTDGWITKGNTYRPNTVGIHLANKDKDHLEKFKKAIDSDYEIHVNKSNNNSVYYSVVSEKMVADLAQYGVVICKTGRCYFPEGLISQELVRHYWRGCVDGDGCLSALVTEDKFLDRTDFCGDYCLVNAFKQYCSINNINGYFSRDHRVKTNFWIYETWDIDASKLNDLLYQNCNIVLNRKLIRYQNLLQSVFIKYKGNENHYKSSLIQIKPL